MNKGNKFLPQTQIFNPYIWADTELQPLSVRGGEDFTADFTFVYMTSFSTIFN